MVSLARTDAKLNSARAAAPDNVQQPLLFFCTKIRPGHLAVNGVLKTIFVFYCGKIPAKQVLCSRRSKVSASRPYAPDTRGVCFQGPSRALWYLISRCGASHGTKHRPGSEISQNACGGCCTSAHRLHGWMRFSASYRCIAQ